MCKTSALDQAELLGNVMPRDSRAGCAFRSEISLAVLNRIWSPRLDLNQRPLAYQTSATYRAELLGNIGDTARNRTEVSRVAISRLAIGLQRLQLAGQRRFERRLAGLEAAVLPLDD